MPETFTVYGTYDLSFRYEKDGLDLSIEPEDGKYLYRRTLNGQKKTRTILSSGGRLIINPVEPLNLPKEICRNLLVEFEPLSIEPGAEQTVYLTFPVEIGVFVAGRGNLELLDIFSWNSQKYTLYGSSEKGVIARWWPSTTHSSPPDLDPLKEGLLSLEISNTTREWVKVSKVVLDSFGMKIYYGDLVSVQAWMRVLSTMVAETGFYDRSAREGQKKAVELFAVRGLAGVERQRFLMDRGL
ncbi:MAG: DUF432 domain-containing protein [Methanofollis sp.]|uniref:DUF432 domain-containing protein n=1 Tax=Methanofollis sp. TaxID=2052835 RepID=UPI00261963A2|nr:DUF432 domain-containing protein [Methanofollis sp.]MDD4255448.1 DUF432 domain-containing protein [Methanofollis sp.]